MPDLVIHAFTDGRDTSPTSGAASLAGDRGGLPRARAPAASARSSAATSRWTATSAGTGREQAVDLLVRGHGRAPRRRRARQAVKAAYERDETDEFITADDGRRGGADPPGRRRARLQLPPRPDAPDHDEAGRGRRPLHDADVSTTRTGRSRSPSRRTARRSRSREVIADAGRAQLHVAETEKYPHVTYFFNGGEEEPYEGEVRELAPSPRDVPTYDHKPEMSAREATEAFLRHWEEQDFALRDHQLRERRHGRAHRRDRGGGQGGRDRRRVPRPDRRGGPREGRRVHRHRRPRQRRRDARGGRLARHRALAQPRAVRRHRRARTRSTARGSSPTSRRRRSRCSGSSSRSR